MKYKLATLAFAVSISAISVYGLIQPTYELGLFLGLNPHFTQARLMIVAILISYTFIPAIRLKVSQMSLLFCGLIFLGVGVTSTISPGMLGDFSRYMVIGDLVILIETGVLAILLAAELPARKSLPRADLLIPAYYIYRLALQHITPVKARTELAGSARLPKIDLTRKQTA
jgi:hypothetical protein